MAINDCLIYWFQLLVGDMLAAAGTKALICSS